MSEQLFDVIIVGGASAGLTSALYASRQGLKTMVLTKDIGGQALLTSDIQNYPGFLTVGGLELTQKFEEQAKLFGTQFIFDEAVELRERDDCPGACYAVKATEAEYYAPVIILAFGKTPRDLGVPGEQKLKGKGVSYCAVCDGPLFKGRVVSVIGSFDQAMDAAQDPARERLPRLDPTAIAIVAPRRHSQQRHQIRTLFHLVAGRRNVREKRRVVRQLVLGRKHGHGSHRRYR